MKQATSMALGAALLAGLSHSTHALAQEEPKTSQPTWTGEWGQFSLTPLAPGKTREDFSGYQGRSLSLSNCIGDQCKVAMDVREKSGHCDASGEAQIESGTRATVHIHQQQFECSLYLERIEGEAGTVTTLKADPGPESCSAFCTPGATFAGSYPLRSNSNYFGNNQAVCYAEPGLAQKALCSSRQLSDQETQWTSLLWKASDLGPKMDEPVERRKLVAGCDPSADPSICLADAFQRSSEALKTQIAAWNVKVTEPGDPQDAREKIDTIAGRYQHSFTNGDVQGDTFISTDELRIEKASDISIRYSLSLSFYNGHECSRTGVATYRRGGMFADHTEGASGNACVFEIVPTAEGIQLADPTGFCRLDDCGARGGYNGASFKNSERTAVQPSAAGDHER